MDNHLAIKEYDRSNNIPALYKRFEHPPEKEVHLRDYLKVIMKRRWIVLIFFVSVFISTAVFTLMMTPIYKSTAVIRVNQEVSDPLLVAGSRLERADTSYFSTQQEILKSSALAERVIKKLDLAKRKDFLPAESTLAKITNAITYPFSYTMSYLSAAFTKTENEEGKPADKLSRANDDVPLYLISSLIGRLSVTPVKNSELVEVSFMSDKPGLSMEVANAVADTYIEYDLESRIEATRQAKEFLTNQIAIVRKKLEESEKNLNQYASEKEVIFVDSDKQSIMTQKLSEITAALSAATTERMQKESLIKEVNESGTENPVILNTPLIQTLKQQLATLEAEYANLSKTFKPDYPKMQNMQSQIDSIQKKIDREKAIIVKSLDSDYKASVKKEGYFKNAFAAQQKRVLEFQSKAAQYQTLKSEVVVNTQLHNGLLQKLNEVGVAVMSKSTSLQVVDRARYPEMPFKPNKSLNLMLSVVFGLIGGIGLAFLVEYFDNTVKDAHDLEQQVQMPTLGMIPLQKELAVSRDMMIERSKDNSQFTEAFRSIGTLLLLSASARPPKSILVSSPGEKEGKTTVAISTAIALTEILGNGIIIDADLRRPRLHEIFKMEDSPGLSTYLSGNIGFNGIDGKLIRPTSIKGLSIMTSGPVPPNPSELLLSSMTKDLLDELYTLFNFIIIDSVPIMGMPESIYLSKIVDGSLIVARGGQTVNAALLETKRIFTSIDARILGVVLNGTSEHDLRYGYYSYYNSYFNKQ